MKVLYKNINPTKLHQELIRANIIPICVENDLKEKEFIAENTWVTFKDGEDMEKVQQIINSLDNSPSPQLNRKLVEEEIQEIKEQNQILQQAIIELSMLIGGVNNV